MSFGFGSFWIDASAFSGSLIATLLVFTIASGNGSWGPTRLLLTGVVLASGFSAITTLILALSSEQTVRGMLFWMMGDLSFAYYPMHLIYLLLVITFITSFLSRYFDILSRGEIQASILGIEVKFFRMMIFIITAVATSLSVTAVGVIGFVGLVVPHSVRLIVGSKHRYVFPASALAGGILLVIADTLARTILAPRQLPVGALTALIGVPLFIILMKKSLVKKR
jgi:iron complex transport system permease protein